MNNPVGRYTPWDETSCGMKNPVGRNTPWDETSCGMNNPVGRYTPWHETPCGMKNPVGRNTPWDETPCGMKHPGRHLIGGVGVRVTGKGSLKGAGLISGAYDMAPQYRPRRKMLEPHHPC
eukprot:351986-Chlamydomonas_euryale.AAC.5